MVEPISPTSDFHAAWLWIEKQGVALGARLADRLSGRQNLRRTAGSEQASGL